MNAVIVVAVAAAAAAAVGIVIVVHRAPSKNSLSASLSLFLPLSFASSFTTVQRLAVHRQQTAFFVAATESQNHRYCASSPEASTHCSLADGSNTIRPRLRRPVGPAGRKPPTDCHTRRPRALVEFDHPILIPIYRPLEATVIPLTAAADRAADSFESLRPSSSPSFHASAKPSSARLLPPPFEMTSGLVRHPCRIVAEGPFSLLRSFLVCAGYGPR